MLGFEVPVSHGRLGAVPGIIAHLGGAGSDIPVWWLTLAFGLLAIVTIEHVSVAHGGIRPSLHAMRRHSPKLIGIGLVVAISALLLPAGQAQSAPGPLPDLISDPPNPSFFKEIFDADGDPRLVITFDGYVHNIGAGALDVAGNPQRPDGMKQRVRTDDGWEDIGTPTVRFETDDGHNHFHLIEAVDYVLWNELQGSQTAIGSKVGFCLVDSEEMEPGTDAMYNEDMNNFCQEANPTATDLRMGISPGWRDNYDATTTLQWVDVSSVAPGRYWIGAITDPQDEIVESDEGNNAIVYSRHTIAVPGFAPRPMPDVVVDKPEVPITLASTPHGDVTAVVYTVVTGPTSGTLDVPVGADLDSPVIAYRPDPGFDGTDEIVFSVHDANSRYPLERPTQSVKIVVRAGAGEASDPGEPADADLPVLLPPSTFFEMAVGETFDVDIPVGTPSGGAARLYARGLPTGLTVNSTDGTISGAATASGIYEVELIAVGASSEQVTVMPVTWIVNAADPSMNLASAPDRSSARNVALRIRLGASGLGLSFEANGLPPGVTIEANQPVLVGTPSEIGIYQVDVRQLDGRRVIAETTFRWVIRPSTDIAFPL